MMTIMVIMTTTSMMAMLMIYDDCGDDDDDGDDQLQRLDGGRVPRKEQRMEEAFLQRSLVGTTPHCTKCTSRGGHFSNQVAAAACALLISQGR